MPAAAPKMEAVRVCRLDRALVLCITDSGTIGAICISLSVGMAALLSLFSTAVALCRLRN